MRAPIKLLHLGENLGGVPRPVVPYGTLPCSLPMGGQRAGRQIPDVEGGGGGAVGHWDRSGEGSGIRGGSSEFRGRPIARLNRIGNLRASVEDFLEFARRGSANGTPLEVVSGGRFLSALEGPKADATETPHFPKEPEVVSTPSNFFGALRAQHITPPPTSFRGEGTRWSSPGSSPGIPGFRSRFRASSRGFPRKFSAGMAQN